MTLGLLDPLETHVGRHWHFQKEVVGFSLSEARWFFPSQLDGGTFLPHSEVRVWCVHRVWLIESSDEERDLCANRLAWSHEWF